ncbi:EamA family transporter [Nonomuraea ferruginea]
MPAGLTSLVLQMQVLFTILFAVTLLGERLTARRVTGLAVAFGGLALVALDFGASGPIGAFALCVAAAAAWGLGNIAQRKAAPPDSLRFMVWVSALSSPPLLLLSLWLEGVPTLTAPLEGWLSLLYVAFVSTLVGFGVWGFLLRRYDASTVAPLHAPRAGLRHDLGRPLHRRALHLAPHRRRRPHRHRRPVRGHPPTPSDRGTTCPRTRESHAREIATQGTADQGKSAPARCKPA